MAHLERAIALKPEFAEAYANLGDLWREHSRPEDARACYARSAVLTRQDGLRLKSTLSLPIIPQSIEVIERGRTG